MSDTTNWKQGLQFDPEAVFLSLNTEGRKAAFTSAVKSGELANVAMMLKHLPKDTFLEEKHRGPAPILVHIAQHGQPEKLTALFKLALENGAKLTDRQQYGGHAALHYTCERDLPDATAFLLDKGAEPNLQTGGNYPGDTPLICAARVPDSKCLKVLLSHEKNPADVNLDLGEYSAQRTAGHAAALLGQLSNLQVLGRYGATLGPSPVFKDSVILNAAESGNIKVVEWLRSEHKANIKGVDKYENGALHHVRHAPMLGYLLENDRLPIDALNKDGMTPAYYLTKSEKVAQPVVHAMLESGANSRAEYVAYKNAKPESFLVAALSSKQNDTAHYLIEKFNKEKDSYPFDEKNRDSIIYAALQNGDIRLIEAIEKSWKLKKIEPAWEKALLRPKDEHYYKNFMLAASTPEAVEYLFSKNYPSTGAAEALYQAVQNNATSLARAFVQHGVSAEVKQRDGVDTALHLAASANNRAELLPMLNHFGIADFTVKDRDGNTPLHLFFKTGPLDDAALRAFAGPEAMQHQLGFTLPATLVCAQNNRGETVLHQTVAQMDTEGLKLLLRHGGTAAIDLPDNPGSGFDGTKKEEKGKTPRERANDMLKTRVDYLKKDEDEDGVPLKPEGIEKAKGDIKALIEIINTFAACEQPKQREADLPEKKDGVTVPIAPPGGLRFAPAAPMLGARFP